MVIEYGWMDGHLYHSKKAPVKVHFNVEISLIKSPHLTSGGLLLADYHITSF